MIFFNEGWSWNNFLSCKISSKRFPPSLCSHSSLFLLPLFQSTFQYVVKGPEAGRPYPDARCKNIELCCENRPLHTVTSERDTIFLGSQRSCYGDKKKLWDSHGGAFHSQLLSIWTLPNVSRSKIVIQVIRESVFIPRTLKSRK